MESSRKDQLVGRDSVEPRDITELRQRRHPAKGVFIFLDRATIVFVTVCSRERKRHLANPTVHDALLKAWSKADLWMIGAYVIMPDHIHFFCSPTDDKLSIERWITFWKREFRRQLGDAAPRFQSDSSTIACEARKVIPKNGNMLERTQ